MIESKAEQNLLSVVKAYTWDNLVSDLKNQREGLKTGYPIRIPHGAITIIAGGTSNGKTAFQLNLLRNLLQEEALKDRKFYFFSYEEDRRNLAIKLIMIMAGVFLDYARNFEAYVGYLKRLEEGKSRSNKKAIQMAVKNFQEYTTAGNERVYFDDQSHRGEKLAAILKELGRDRHTGAVFIDYIQKIPVEGSSAHSLRYLEIKKVSELLLGAAKTTNIPIIVGAQKTRSARGKQAGQSYSQNLRESADSEHDASVILDISRESLEKGQATDNTKPEPLKVYITKNRTGPMGQRVFLNFEGPILRVSDRRSSK